ncbi:MAG TPA: cbb3-type cytochrome c oxidase subunit I [Solirubrobacteraceae bacterium]|nr:cbb3-type cytochrome c oxidase subunit I [Solirubrobacteraceae bacterium]
MRFISTDHKRIGINLVIASLGWFLVGGVFALLMRAQLSGPSNHVLSNASYDEVFTMHGSTMIYLFVTPMALAMGTYLIPLQIGARGLAAPRLALAGFWVWMFGGLIMQSGWFVYSGPGQAGWTAFAPLSNSTYTPGYGQDLWTLGVLLAVLGMIFIAVSLALTIMRRRAPGMTMMRMPIFTWTALVAVLLVIGAFPMLVIAMSLLFADRLGAHIFTGFAGSITYQDLFWFFGHPVVYVMFFPYLGAAAEAVAVNAQKRWFGYTAFVASMLAFSVLSMSVWGHHMFVTDGLTNEYFAFTSTLLLVPAGIEYFDLVGTLIRGRIIPRTAFLFGLGFFIQFLIGGLTGIFTASPVLDYNVYGSYFIVAHFHYTLFAGSVFGFFAGVYHWFPKLTGAKLREGLGKVHLVVIAVGTNLTFMPMFFLGADGMPRRVANYPANPEWGTLNALSTAGSGIVAIAMLIFMANVVISLRHRIPAGDDPWLGHTLEWATSSPPPPLNFVAPLPPIRSYAPLLDLREAVAAQAERAAVGLASGTGAAVPAQGPISDTPPVEKT